MKNNKINKKQHVRISAERINMNRYFQKLS